MKKITRFLFIAFLSSSCSNPESKTTISETSIIEASIEPQNKQVNSKSSSSLKAENLIPFSLEDIYAKSIAFRATFGKDYDAVPYVSSVQGQLYFMVIRGKWNMEYWEKGDESFPLDYKVGLVNEQNDPIIPVEYQKLYNIGGTASNLIVVENDRQLGAYNLKGQQLLKTEFDGIYPYKNEDNIWVQVRKDEQFGYLDRDGQLQMNPSTTSDKSVFEVQKIASLIKSFQFNVPSNTLFPFSYINDLKYPDEYKRDLIVYPSYLHGLGIVPPFRHIEASDKKDLDSRESTAFQIQKGRTTGRIQTLLTYFENTFMSPRDYYTNINEEIVTLNENMEKIDVLSIKADRNMQACNNVVKFKFIHDKIIEVASIEKTNYQAYQLMSNYMYYGISETGTIIAANINGDFKFTRLIKITDAYFKGCFSRDITAEELARHDGEYLTYTNTNHLSIEDLDVMRNEIFAAYGYRFKSKKWQNYFHSKSWYQPQFDNGDHKLTDIEKHNIQVILEQKEKMKDNEEKYLQTSYGAFHAAG